MGGRNSTIAPQQQARRIANHSETSSTTGGYHDGAANEHALTTVLHDTPHDDQHHCGGGEIVQIGRDDEGGDGDGPQQTFGVVGLDPFLHKVETAVVIENLNDGHCGQQEHHDAGSPTHVIQEYLITDIEFHGTTRRFLTGEIVGIFTRVL